MPTHYILLKIKWIEKTQVLIFIYLQALGLLDYPEQKDEMNKLNGFAESSVCF